MKFNGVDVTLAATQQTATFRWLKSREKPGKVIVRHKVEKE